MGEKDIQVFKTSAYPLLCDIVGLRNTAYNIQAVINDLFLPHAKICLVGCGTSGATLMTAISVLNEMDSCLITKRIEEENSHRTSKTLNLDNYNYLIVVDDRIETGATMNRIASVLANGNHHLKVKMVCVKYSQTHKTTLKESFPNLKYLGY